MRSGSPEDGFHVEISELDHTVGRLDDVVADQRRHQRREDTIVGYAAAPDTTTGAGRSRAGARDPATGGPLSLPAPGWLEALDQRWVTYRARLLAATHAAGEQLRATRADYVDLDAHLAYTLTDTTATPHPTEPGQRPTGIRLGDVHGETGPPGVSAAGSAGLDLARAVALWRHRVTATGHALTGITADAAAVPGWTGPAAHAYRSWLEVHRQRWAALLDDAERLHRHLADAHDRTATDPTTAADGQSTPIALSIDTVDHDAAAPLLPGVPTPAAPTTAAAAPDRDQHPTAEPGQALTSTIAAALAPTHGQSFAGPPTDNPDRPVTGTAPSDRSAPEITVTPEASTPPAGDVPGAAATDTAQAAPAAATGEHKDSGTGPGDAAADTAGLAVLGVANAAAAAAAVLARQDRALHITHTMSGPIISRIHLDPPPITTQTLESAAGRVPLPRVAPAANPAPDRPSSPTSDAEAVTVALPLPLPLPATTPPPPLWVDLGPDDGPPAQVDLAAPGGLALTGPGAHDVARTVLTRLATHSPPPQILLPRTLGADHADGPVNPDDSDDSDGLPPSPRSDPDQPAPPGGADDAREAHPPPYLTASTPHHALQLTEAELQQRRHGHPAGAWVLVVEAPATPRGHQLLHHTLTTGHHLGVTAVLLGDWPHGTTLRIDRGHHVIEHTRTDHTRPPASSPADLAGAALHPTSATDLHDVLHPVAAPQPRTAPSTDATQAGPSPASQPSAPGPAPEPASEPPGGHDQTYPPPVPPGEQVPRTRAGHENHATTDTRPVPLSLHVLGPTALHHHPDPADPTASPQAVGGLGPRATELLVYLAAHPNGVARANLVATLWPDTPPDRPTNALNATLSRLRSTVSGHHPDLARLVVRADDRYHLDPHLISVDYWTFLIAARDITDHDPQHRARACETVIDTYRGPLAVDHTGEWLITLREATRRRHLDALTTLAQLTITDDPDRTLGLLETARNHEPLNESLYRDIMRIHAQHARYTSAENTYTLLRTQLDDIDAEPEPATTQLLRRIREREQQRESTDR